VPEEVTPALWSPRSVLETASSREALAGCIAGEVERLQSCWARPEPRVAREGWTLFCGESDFHAACGVARWVGRDRAGGYNS